jgi:hypothetical protein
MLNDCFTKEDRRVVCVHEAGHAVIHAIGGSCVYRVAVAPEGTVNGWTTRTRKGAALIDLYGVCEPSEYWISPNALKWDGNTRNWDCNIDYFNRDILRSAQANCPDDPDKYVAAQHRQVRLLLCGSLGGPIAERLVVYGDVWFEDLEYDEVCVPNNDITAAKGYARLLPHADEYKHAFQITKEIIQRPEIWQSVMQLADELERLGDLYELMDFLPDIQEEWPPPPPTM